MTTVLEKLPAEPSDQPPIVLIHGAANSASVWTYWQDALAQAGIASYAVNLRGHGPEEHDDLSNTSMHDYADDVRSCVEQLDGKPVVMGWSMGGLLAMMVAATGEAVACIGLAPAHQHAPSIPPWVSARESLGRRSTASRAAIRETNQQCPTLT